LLLDERPELLLVRLLRVASDFLVVLPDGFTDEPLSRELPGALSLPGFIDGLVAGFSRGLSLAGFAAGRLVPGFEAGLLTSLSFPGRPVGCETPGLVSGLVSPGRVAGRPDVPCPFPEGLTVGR
jgi:hypothetical protein